MTDFVVVSNEFLRLTSADLVKLDFFELVGLFLALAWALDCVTRWPRDFAIWRRCWLAHRATRPFRERLRRQKELGAAVVERWDGELTQGAPFVTANPEELRAVKSWGRSIQWTVGDRYEGVPIEVTP